MSNEQHHTAVYPPHPRTQRARPAPPSSKPYPRCLHTPDWHPPGYSIERGVGGHASLSSMCLAPRSLSVPSSPPPSHAIPLSLPPPLCTPTGAPVAHCVAQNRRTVFSESVLRKPIPSELGAVVRRGESYSRLWLWRETDREGARGGQYAERCSEDCTDPTIADRHHPHCACWVLRRAS